MEEDIQHFQPMMLHYFKNGTNTTERQIKMCAVYGEGGVTDHMCQKWLAKVLAGDFSLEDAPWSVDQVKLTVIKSRH